MINRTAAHLAFRNRALAAAGVPALRALENVRFDADTTGLPYLRESFVPATRQTITYGGRTDSLEEETGIYVITIYMPEGSGITALNALARAILLRFTPGLDLTAGSDVVRITGKPAPWPGQIIPNGDGHAYITVTVPWRAWSRAA